MTPNRRFLTPEPAFVVDGAPKPTFSVIIAAHDVAPLVGEAVDSVLRQTVAPVELIVFDDGSTDDLAGALAPFEPQVTLVRGDHRGPAAARNRALAFATGDFVAVLDADDAYAPGRLEALQELAAARPDLDVLATDAALEVDGRVVGRFNDATPFVVGDQRTAILQACFVCASAVRRSRLGTLGAWDEDLEPAEDWDLVLRLILSGCPAGLVAEPLYRYRLHAGSLTSRRVFALAARVRMLEKATRRPGLSREEERTLERSLITQRRRLLRAEAETAAIDDTADRRKRALRLAAARGVPLRDRATALSWSVSPSRARRALATESAPPWKRAAS
jgi:glycosyltransferase involved in cell wall biosynthesis